MYYRYQTKKMKNKEGKTIHDTEKPVELGKILIENSSNVGDLVFDPFMGIGFAAVASVEMGRKFIGSELDVDYYNVTKDRAGKCFQKEDK